MSNRIYITYDQIEDISCNRVEQETAINWMRDDDIAVVCTSDYTVVTRISKAMAKDPNNYRCYYFESNRNPDTGRLSNYFFEIPKKLISFHCKKEGGRRPMTEEERKAVGERFRKAREAAKA
ncbi:MAG: hypothetical protein J6R47_05715 [Acholeplasmatales bacterium]|nr:hypothetical protein [Acholeplasmatales bacterium]